MWLAVVAELRHGHGVYRSSGVLQLLLFLALWDSRASCLSSVLLEFWTSERSAGERLVFFEHVCSDVGMPHCSQ